MLGKTICGRYQLTQELGKSHFATTFVAEDSRIPGNPKPKCVVKQLTPQLNDYFTWEQAQDLFEREAKILRKLGDYPQIPLLLDYCQDERQFYLIQELIKGHNLSTEFNTNRDNFPYTEAQTITLIKELLEILVFVHNHHCIHRDIKPANIMRRNLDGKIVLIDFGAVKDTIATKVINAQGVAKASIVIGTLGYIPYEQSKGDPQFASDLYAVGMIGIQSITGIDPSLLPEDSDGEKIWRDRLPSGRIYRPNFLDFLDKMIRFRYQERYQLAQQALADLDRLTMASSPIPTPDRSSDSKILRKIFLTGGIATLGILSWWSINHVLTPNKFLNYENQKYGIKIDYPETWTIKEYESFLTQEITFESPLDHQQDSFQDKLSLNIQDLSSHRLSLSEYAKNLIPNNVTDLQTSEASLANRQAKKIIYSYQEDGNELQKMQVFTLKNNRAYVITYTAEKDQYHKFLSHADKIINSFKIE